MAEDKIMCPKIRFPEFHKEWNEEKINNIFSIFNGYAFPGDDATSEGVVWVKIADVGIQRMEKNRVSYLPEKFAIQYSRFLLKEGDYVIALTRPILNGKLKISQINSFYNNSLLNQRVGKIISTNKYAFVYNLLQKESLINKIDRYIAGTDPPNLSPNEIKAIKQFIPSIEEQQKIALFLISVDKRIDLLIQKKMKLEQYKKSVMQQIFNQEIRFKNEDRDNFPKWEEKTLGKIGIFQTSSIDKLSREKEEEVFLVNYMNVYRHESINNETVKQFQKVTASDNQILSCDLKKGDILFTPSSETPNDIGHSVVIFEDLENTVYSYHLMRFRPIVEMDILYSHYFCNTTNVLNQLSRLSTGSTRFTISVKAFSSVIVSLPVIEEQKKIAAFLSAIDKKIEKTSTQVDFMKNWKKGLLQQMFV